MPKKERKHMLQYHSHYDSSVLDGASRIEDAIKRAKELGYTALGITDHGTGQGLFRFYKQCKEAGIKPVLGCELYMGEKDEQRSYHLIALAQNNKGLENLFTLITKANMENFYRKPRVTMEMLKQHSAGLTFTSACLGSKMASYFFDNDVKGAIKHYEEMCDITNYEYYLEIQPNEMPEQVRYNKWLYENFKDRALFTVNSDMHYVRKEDSTTHDTLLAMQVKKKKSDTDRFKFQGTDYYMMSTEELLCKLGYLPEDLVRGAIKRTSYIADACNVEIDTTSNHLPKVENEKVRLAELCNAGFKRRMEEGHYEGMEIQKVIERIQYELKVITEKGYASYFLIVSDYIKFATNNCVYIGAGRGSVGGSEVAFILGIQEVEPIKHGLLFERFLNPDRQSPPDIDSDFCYEDREKVIEYIREKYGKDNTAHIIAEGRFTLKKALRDVMRSYEYSEQYIAQVSKTIPDTAVTFEDAFKTPEFVEKIANIKEEALADMLKIEGMVSHNSKHAAGILITPQEVWKYVPCSRDSDNPEMMMSQWDKKTVEAAGIYKFDILGLKLLTIFKKTLHKIGKDRDWLNAIDLKDPNIYKILCSNNMHGIFQMEGSSAKAVINEVQPKCFEDVVACEAICRPGVKEAQLYISSKKIFAENNTFPIPEYWHKVKHILESTYGALVYQEQTMLLFKDIGGFTLGEADSLRKVKSLEPYRDRFVNNAVIVHGFTTEEANSLFDRFDLGYSFNKSHAVAYALNTVQCAYLKHYYPAEFMAAVLTLELTKGEPEVKSVLQECRGLGISIMPPNINKSSSDFIAEGKLILMPMTSIAGIGDNVIKAIEEHRPYTNLEDFLAKVQKKQCNKSKVINLIKGGAFDSLNKNRSVLLESYYKAIKVNEEVPFWCDEAQMMYEKEVYGYYLMKHPLDGTTNININDHQNGANIPINAIITKVRYNKDRNGNMMAFATAENKSCTFDVIAFAGVFARKNVQALLKEGMIVKMTGKVDGGKLLLNEIQVI